MDSVRGDECSGLCALCGEEDEMEEEQVMCNACDKGFHLKCLDEESIEYPEDVFEDGVSWMCVICLDEAALKHEAERLSVRDLKARASRSGKVVQKPARYL
jgi:hypothetical protein